MKQLTRLVSLIVIILASCSTAPTQTPTPSFTPIPPTETPVPPGIQGHVEYQGASNGSILILAVDHQPAQGENPEPVAIETYVSKSGDFFWELPAGTYYITAFFTIDRPPQGPPQPNEPLVFCNPIQIDENETVTIQVVLTDEAIGGFGASCEQ